METDRQSAVELDDALFLFPFLFDPYSNTGTPAHRSTSIRKEYHEPDDHQCNSGPPEVRQHRHRGTGTTNPQLLQKADGAASFNHRARSPRNSFLLSAYTPSPCEARILAANQLFKQESEVRFGRRPAFCQQRGLGRNARSRRQTVIHRPHKIGDARMPQKKNSSFPMIRQNCRPQNKVPIPPDVYQYVREHMQDLTLDELRTELQVSRRIARALRNGVQIKLSEDLLTILNSNIGFDRRYCLGSRIRWTVGESRDRELYVELNRYLAKVIAEMPEIVAKATRGGWTTRHLIFLRPLSPWCNQLLVLQLLAELKQWYTKVHERYPEFDPVLFAETGLFDQKPSDEKPNKSKRPNSTPVRSPRRKSVSFVRPCFSKEFLASIILGSLRQASKDSTSRGQFA